MSKKGQNESSTTKDEKFSIMDSLICNPGLSKVAEQIFEYLNNESLLSCILVAKDWNIFLINKSKLLSWRKLEWLLNIKVDTARWGARCIQMNSILTLFPDWINVLNYFKRNGSLEDLKEIVKVLDLYFTKYDKDPGPYMKSPIFAAASHRHFKFLEILFNAHIEVDFNPKNAVQDPTVEAVYTPIEDAMSEEDFTTLKLFLDNTDLISTVPTGSICSRITPDNLKLLLSHEKGKNLDFKALDDDGLSVLFWACFHYSGSRHGPGVLKLLLDHSKEFDLDVNLTADYGTPLKRIWYLQDSWEDFYYLEKLRKNGKCEVGKGTALHAACWVGNSDCVKILMDQAKQLNINVAATDTYGRTVLHIAAIYHQVDFMEFLLPRSKELGIDLKAKDWQGHTFFQSACVAENRELVTYLVDQAKEYGLDIDPKDEEGQDWFDTIEDHPALLYDNHWYSGNEKKKREKFVLFFQDLICKK